MTDHPAAADVQTGRGLHHHAANYAVWSLVGSVALSIFGAGMAAQAGAPARQVLSIVAGLVMLSAMPAGLIALLGIPRHGPSGLLWKGILGIAVPIALAAMAVPAFLKVRRSALERANRSVATSLAKEFNTSAPKMLDEVTRLDGAEAGLEKTVTVHLTLVSLDARDVDRAAWTAKVVPSVRAGVEKSPMLPLVKNGVTVIYRYFGRDGVKIDDVVFAPADYSGGRTSH